MVCSSAKGCKGLYRQDPSAIGRNGVEVLSPKNKWQQWSKKKTSRETQADGKQAKSKVKKDSNYSDTGESNKESETPCIQL